ncbi:L-2-amino-thiazoline-4-carboxylic acid hydrolase [Desulfocurvibacter africanus]|uniref:L-2-amino-thiazoline-4-carboxylic acid hydrolase n=1 Tax=Desulfocurvibacter africanus TaxID=873 RepID=UPI002FD987CD
MPLLTQTEQRRFEADILRRVFETLIDRTGRAEALKVIGEATRDVAREAGKALAESCDTTPNLPHFATVVNTWRSGRSLDIGKFEIGLDKMRVVIKRCAHIDAYRELGLPDDLACQLACVREEAFAEGYSTRLSFKRPTSICQDNKPCELIYTWK